VLTAEKWRVWVEKGVQEVILIIIGKGIPYTFLFWGVQGRKTVELLLECFQTLPYYGGELRF